MQSGFDTSHLLGAGHWNDEANTVDTPHVATMVLVADIAMRCSTTGVIAKSAIINEDLVSTRVMSMSISPLYMACVCRR
jgi:hypothetical protein